MTNDGHIERLLEETTVESGVRGMRRVAMDQWTLDFDEGTAVDVRLQPERKCLTVRIELGRPPADMLLDTYEAMMAYSGFSDQTGGIHIALDASDGKLVQMLDLFTADLDGATLANVLRNFVEKARVFKSLLADGRLLAGKSGGVIDEGGASR